MSTVKESTKLRELVSMHPMNKQELKELQTIPGIGKSISQDFWNVGIKSVVDLKGYDPEKLYRKICNSYGREIDRCLLYVCRCAVYYASTKKHNPEKLKWWNWKDAK